MDWLQQLDVQQFLLFTLVLTRVSGLVMVAPIYGTKEVPMQVRAFLAVALAVLIMPTQWDVEVAYPGTMVNYMVFIGSELAIGVCLGLGIVILFSGAQLCGQMIGRVGGMMLADVFDPSVGARVSMFGRLLFLVAMAVFVCIGGHRMLMAGLLDTFATIPPGSGAFPVSIAHTFTTLLHESFSLGIRAALPVVTALMLSLLVLGLIGRTLPQLNILVVGFGLNSMLTFATLSLTIGGAAWAFQEQIEPTITAVLEALHLPLG